jgi:hypothetical protein
VAFSLSVAAETTLELLDVSGRRVAQRALGYIGAGPQLVTLGSETRGLPAGLYFVRVSQGAHSATGRVVLAH